ncbi:MAG: hypothetical protein BWX45_01215 [Deltaproteobacteria bacterium ADurb.Bin002]|nr:MAG: hypothetical protein BWX45_01215 [Deltaproteobacteria bacterium ADurb.Bin002]
MDVPVFLLMNFNWSTGAKNLPHLGQACILKVRPHILRRSPVEIISICPVGQT